MLLFASTRPSSFWVELERITKRERMPERVSDALFDAALGLRVRRATYHAAMAEELSEQAAGRNLRQSAERGLLLPHGEKRRQYDTGSPEMLETWRQIRSKQSGRPVRSLSAAPPPARLSRSSGDLAPTFRGQRRRPSLPAVHGRRFVLVRLSRQPRPSPRPPAVRLARSRPCGVAASHEATSLGAQRQEALNQSNEW
jgi:hypothetical protein